MRNQVIVLRQIAALPGGGATLILSTHDLDHAVALGTRVVRLHKGNILSSGSRKQR